VTPPPPRPFIVGGRYAWYVLAICTFVSAFSLLDRQILTIIGADLKADLKLSDAEVGVLYGTVFGIFYALFGIALGRLADRWSRTKLLALSLGGWSVMTVLSGMAGGFGTLAAARAGVAVGEAGGNPAAFSLLADWFPKHRRGTVMAIFGCGVSIGLGASMTIGGLVVDAWKHAYAPGAAPLGLHAWQVAFIVIGLPGLALAALVSTLREPPRGLSDGVIQPPLPRPFAAAGLELVAVLPLLSFIRLRQLKAGTGEYWLSAAGLICVAAGAVLLTRFSSGLVPPAKLHALFSVGGVTVTSHALQWGTLALGVAVVLAWVQTLRLGDRPTWRLIWATPSMVALTAASALFMTINYGLMAWSAIYAMTRFHAPASQVGPTFGAIAAGVGLVGTFLGGWLSDIGLRYSKRARLWVTLFSMIMPWPMVHLVYSARTLNEFYWLFPWLSIVTTLWLPAAMATGQDLVLPRMRGATAATYNLATSMIGLAMGPFLIGLISDATGSLKTGVLSIYWISPVIWLCMAVALAYLPRDESTRIERARAEGEPV